MGLGTTTNGLIKEIALARPFEPDGGHAFIAHLPADVPQHYLDEGIAILLEDGRPLGPADIQHIHIRKQGGGLYSLWKRDIHFSASDNTDCNENGRTYELALLDFSHGSPVFRHASQQLSADDGALLALINDNHSINNSFFLNFFSYYNVVAAMLARNGIPLPQSAIELGTGKHPYTALRFLFEGTQRFVVNDIMHVADRFEEHFLKNLHSLLDLVMPGRKAQLDKIQAPHSSGNAVAIRGLEVHDGLPFEQLTLDGDFDLVFSTSVLEHVMQPREVVARMKVLLRAGGHAWHSIDLRDHRDFNEPLAFLELTTEDYASINSENRLRASDWFKLFSDEGLELLECEFCAFKSASEPTDVYSFTPPRPWVSKAMRTKFTAPFKAKELADLSTLAIRVLYRKPT